MGTRLVKPARQSSTRTGKRRRVAAPIYRRPPASIGWAFGVFHWRRKIKRLREPFSSLTTAKCLIPNDKRRITNAPLYRLS